MRLHGARESRCCEPVAFVALLLDCPDDATLWREHHKPAMVVVLVAAHLHLRHRRTLDAEDWFLQGASSDLFIAAFTAVFFFVEGALLFVFKRTHLLEPVTYEHPDLLRAR